MSMGGDKIGYRFAGFRLDPGHRQLYGADGRPVRMRARAFDTLLYLVERAGQLVPKSDLLQAVWPDTIVEENNLNQTISVLRQLLGDDRQSPRFIATITGRGYQFVADVATDAADSPEAGIERPPGFAFGPFRDVRRVAGPAVLGIVLLAAAAFFWLPDGDSAGSRVSEAVGNTIRLAEEALVTDAPGNHRQPALSPDGRSVAFVSDRSGTDQIWVQNLERGDAVQLTFGELAASFPSWSPLDDGIIYQQQRPDGRSSIWRADPLGIRPPRMLRDLGSTPSFFPDGKSFVFAIERTIWTADADGGNRRMVPSVPAGPGFEARRSPAISPDGAWIAFIHASDGPIGNLWIMPTTGGEATQLSDMAALDPVWSADGRHIFIVAASGAGALDNTHIWRIPVGAGEAAQITGGVGGYAFPAVAADGSRLLYTHGRAVWRLMRTNPDTGEQAAVVESRSSLFVPRVSEDGRTVAYFAPVDAGMQLFTVGVDGSDRQQWTFEAGTLNLLPDWRDSDTIYYYSVGSPGSGVLAPPSTLRRLTLADGRDVEVAPDFHFSTRNWVVAEDDRIAFFHHNIRPAPSRTIVRNLADGTEYSLPITFSPTDWSRDGATILGFSQVAGNRLQIVACPANGNDECSILEDEQGPILGREPRWSIGEDRIFFTRDTDRPDYRELWVVDRDGSNLHRLLELGPIEIDVSNHAFGVDYADHVIWGQYDSGGSDEIWMADLR